MKKDFVFAGLREKASQSGRMYGDIYVYDLLPDGTADFIQQSFRTFDDSVLSACRKLGAGDIVSLDLFIKDAFVQGVDAHVEL